MQAEEVSAKQLFSSGQQLLVPRWQRPYSWDKADWSELWRDLERVTSGEAPSHFIGSVVLHSLKWSGLPSEAQQYWVVDGQQRLATLTLLVCAIRDRIARLQPDSDSRNEIWESYTSQLLMNSNLKPSHQARLVLQDSDRVQLDLLIEGDSASSGTLISKGYEFFQQSLQTLGHEDCTKLLSHVLVDLSAVWVVLVDSDNAHRVFQTLNAGGKPLKQVDLVRNYFFLLLGVEGDKFYEKHWKTLQGDLVGKDLDEYFVAWCVSQGHSGSKDSLFRYFQKDLTPLEPSAADVFEYGARLADSARLFGWIRNPEGSNLGKARLPLIDLKNWGPLPAEGLLLHLLRRFEAKELNEEQLAACFEIVLSFLARRALAGYEPQLHKSIMVTTARKMLSKDALIGHDIVRYLRLSLSAGQDVRTWPDDELVLERAPSTPLYTRPRRDWVFSILERVNRELFDYKKHAPEPLSRTKYSIEHVMPQTLSKNWEADLLSWGEGSPSKLHASRLHVLGNLTLSPINSELSNKRFSEKIPMLKDDWLRLNKGLAEVNHWSESAILARSEALAKAALAAFVSPFSLEEVAQQLQYFSETDTSNEGAEAIDPEVDEETVFEAGAGSD